MGKIYLVGSVFVLGVAGSSLVYAQQSVDPTRPATAAGASVTGSSVSSIQVSAVFLSENHARAIINGKSVEKGQRFGSYTLVDVTSDGVVVRTDDARGQSKVILINNHSIKKDVSNDF